MEVNTFQRCWSLCTSQGLKTNSLVYVACDSIQFDVWGQATVRASSAFTTKERHSKWVCGLGERKNEFNDLILHSCSYLAVLGQLLEGPSNFIKLDMKICTSVFLLFLHWLASHDLRDPTQKYSAVGDLLNGMGWTLVMPPQLQLC